jgi:integrase
MTPLHGNLLTNLTGGSLPNRVQRPKIHERKDRGATYWFFRYRHDELQPDGSIKTSRRFHTIAPTKGDGGMSKKGAEAERDKFLVGLNTAATRCEAAVGAQAPAQPEDILFGRLAELWRKDYVNNPMVKLAAPTREKYKTRLDNHILPRWKDARLGDLSDTKSVVDWLQSACTSWHMMVDLRNIMSGMVTRAQEWGVIPRLFANPMQWVKLGRKWTVRLDRIYTFDETATVFSRLADQHLLIWETCLYTGTRISEAVGLQLQHVDLEAGTIKIAQRHCRGDVDEPKTRNSKRVLALGELVDRYRTWIAKKEITKLGDWVFAQEDDHSKPMWDSGVRKALKLAARACEPEGAPEEDPGLDFPGMGLHSFRRANIAWGRATAIASKIAGHANVNMTGTDTFVDLERQDQTTRRIQQRVDRAKAKVIEMKRKETAA